ncbi:MAG: polyamine aminopropyltransferase [bacterium]|nr:polyamine aminopropyltransferase [bacterium]
MKQEYREVYENMSFFGFTVEEWFVNTQSSFQKIECFRSKSHGVVLALDGLIQLTEQDEFIYHEMLVHIPMLVHPNPKNVLIIGGGDGGSAREVCLHTCVERVDMCEIDGQVIETCKQYLKCTATGMNHPKVNVMVGDGIEFVKQAKDNSYDVVIVDSSDPVGPGVGLFNSIFYRDVFRILTTNGIVVAQGESPFYQIAAVRNLRKAMQEVFPITATYLANIPTYPSGLWSFAYAAKTLSPKQFSQQRASLIASQCKYYNEEIHLASFVLPNLVKKSIGMNEK